MSKLVSPSSHLISSLNDAEKLRSRGIRDPLSIYLLLEYRGNLKPNEKELIVRYIFRRSLGDSIKRAMEAIHIASEGLRLTEKLIDKGVKIVIVNPSKFLYTRSDTVRSATDWVVEESALLGDWLRKNTPRAAVRTWSDLARCIKSAKKRYERSSGNIARYLQSEFFVNQELTAQTLERDIPFLAEQAAIIFGTKGLGIGFSEVEKTLNEVRKVRRTGAFTEGVGTHPDLGRLKGKEVRISSKGLDIVKNHLKRFHEDDGNKMMIKRLESSLYRQQTITGADASFYIHEVREATVTNRLMREGKNFDTAQLIAHAEALDRYKVSPFSVYHPEVIDQLPELFSDRWRDFWMDREGK